MEAGPVSESHECSLLRPCSRGPSGPWGVTHTKPLSELSGCLPPPSRPGDPSHIPLTSGTPSRWASGSHIAVLEGRVTKTALTKPLSSRLVRRAWAGILQGAEQTRTYLSCCGAGLLHHPAFLRRQAAVSQATHRWESEWRGRVAEPTLCYPTAPGVGRNWSRHSRCVTRSLVRACLTSRGFLLRSEPHPVACALRLDIRSAGWRHRGEGDSGVIVAGSRSCSTSY